jgi:hypothetical protein
MLATNQFRVAKTIKTGKISECPGQMLSSEVRMKEFDELGLFWLPDHEEDALSGRLKFDPKEGGITLSLVGRFDNAADDDEDSNLRILGWRGNDRVTLDQCLSLGTNRRAPGAPESKFHANQMFVGHHFEEEELSFQSASLRLSDLNSWVGRSGIAVEDDDPRPGSPAAATYQMTFTPPQEEAQRFSRGRVKLTFGWDWGGDPIHGIRFQQWPAITIEYDEIQPFEIIRKDVGRIQDLVTLCIDAPTAVDRLVLRRPDIHARALSGKDAGFQQPIDFVGQPILYSDPEKRQPRHWHQMLLSFEEFGGVEALARWLDVSQSFQRALDSFMSIKHARQMYGENRFLNVTFAAEAFHRITVGGQYMEEEAFKSLLDVCLANTPQRHHEWLLGRISHGNEPPLRKRLQQLAARAGDATRPLIGKPDRWARTLSQVRNELTHITTDSRVFLGADLLFLSESVYAVVRICMLLECGVAPEALIEKANAPTMTWYRNRLKKSLEKARSQLTTQKQDTSEPAQ